jgi:hypothetical protein
VGVKVVAGPTTRYCTVYLDARGQEERVPGLFDSTVEAVAARDAFLVGR